MLRGREKRQAKRVSYVCEIHCEGSGVGKLNTRINDISVTGLFIDSLAHLAVGSVLNLHFAVLGVPVEVEGEVRNRIPQIGMGIQFRNLQPEFRYVIECLVERKPVDKQIFAALASPPIAKESASPQSQSHPHAARPDGQPSRYPHQVPPFPQKPSDSTQQVAQEPFPVKPKTTAELQMMADEAVILVGNCAVIHLFDVIQVLAKSKVSGELIITLPTGSGEIYFNAGRIANARAGERYGIAALNAILSLTEGSFKFRKTDKEYAQSIQTDTGLGLDLPLTDDEKTARR
jgi:hypothetical protein